MCHITIVIRLETFSFQPLSNKRQRLRFLKKEIQNQGRLNLFSSHVLDFFPSRGMSLSGRRLYEGGRY